MQRQRGNAWTKRGKDGSAEEKAVERGGEEGIKTDGDGERMCGEVCERGSRQASVCVYVCESKTKCRSSWGSAAAPVVTVDE